MSLSPTQREHICCVPAHRPLFYYRPNHLHNSLGVCHNCAARFLRSTTIFYFQNPNVQYTIGNQYIIINSQLDYNLYVSKGFTLNALLNPRHRKICISRKSLFPISVVSIVHILYLSIHTQLSNSSCVPFVIVINNIQVTHLGW